VRSKLPGSPDDFRADSGTIHVVCGPYDDLSKAFSISSRDIICLRDDLSCGPLGSLSDLDGWIAMRRAYWDHVADDRPAIRKRRRRLNSVPEEYVFGSLDRLADANEVAIWVGTGLAEQLALAWMPQFLRAIGRRPEAHLTPEGEQFLRGELNFVELNGIDDWVGGVHLDSRTGDVWFNQDRKIVRR
jgi:Domain of unknown function (DUF1835)